MESTITKAKITSITGLRGIAILMIILFHLCPQHFAHGYLGVEVFLVISGYFLFRSYDNHKVFYLYSFCEKKILRIVPLLAFTVIFGLLLALPVCFDKDDITQVILSAFFSLIGISNFYYISVYSDYFATDSNLNPLLHMWYLSITIQIFILWGFFAWLSKSINKKFIIPILLISAICSFIFMFSFQIQNILMEYGFSGWGQTEAISYYHTGARIWQVIAGGFVVYLPTLKNRAITFILTILGLLFISMPMCFNVHFGSISVIGVVIGTMLLLRYYSTSAVDNLLNFKPLILIGEISFSLYLIHFPIIAAYKRWMMGGVSIKAAIPLLLISFIAGSFLFWALEKRKFHIKSAVSFWGAAFCLCIALYKGGAVETLSKGAEYPMYEITNLPHSSRLLKGFDKEIMIPHCGAEVLMWNYSKNPEPLIMMGDKDKNPSFILIGDSNAQHWYSGIDSLCKKAEISGVLLTSVILPLWDRSMKIPVRGYYSNRDKVYSLLDWLKEQRELRTVIIGASWSILDAHCTNWDGLIEQKSFARNVELLAEFCKELKSLDKQVILISPSPHMLNYKINVSGLTYLRYMNRMGMHLNPENTEHPMVLTENAYLTYNQKYMRALQHIEQLGLCQILHVEKGIFSNGSFLGILDGTLRVRDATHITPPASIDIMNAIKTDFFNLVNKDASRKENASE